VYRPQTTRAPATLLDVHGGDWTAGDRFQQALLDRSLAANGLVVAAIDYRLAPPYAYPASVDDVLTAARWLRARRTDLGASSDAPVGALGSSAGGHLAILAALWQPNSFDFVIADAPTTDTSAYAERHPYWPTRDAALSGSPLHTLVRIDARLPADALAQTDTHAALPPLLITHGTRDTAVPIAMSRAFAARYRSAGGRAELLEFEGLDHAFILTRPRHRASREMAQAILRFVQNQMRL
jgi:acetyl esterase/lipase